MGLTVDIGLSRFFYGEEDHEPWKKGVNAVVASGCTNLARDIFAEMRDDVPTALIYEARKNDDGTITGRVLDEDDAKPIRDAILETYQKYDSWAGFSWDQLEEIGAWDIQDLAVVFDGPERHETFQAVICDDHSSKIVDMKRSFDNFRERDSQCRIARALHDLATVHRLIVHCA